MNTIAFASAQFIVDNQYYWKDGKPIKMDAKTFIHQGRVFVPVRYLALAIDIPESGIKWDPATQSVILNNEKTIVALTLNSKTVFINNQPTLSDVASIMVSGRTYLPARIIAEAFGYEVFWDSETQTVTMLPIEEEQQENLQEQSGGSRKKLTVKEIVKLIQPSTVLIETNRGSGSGFFVSTDGEIVTNAHVVRGSKWIKVTTFNKEKYEAEIYKINNMWDLAIIKINADKDFPIIEYFTESYYVEPGEEILVFGNPLGLTNTVTRGIVSAKREWSVSDAWKSTINVIQHDATMSFGNSGGPVVNLYGDFIGINFAGFTIKDFNFAIPAEYYYYLSESEERYNEKCDWYCYWTESWEWEKKHIDIIKMFEESRELDRNQRIPVVNQILSQLENLMQEVSSYYPKYPEIIKLKELYMNLLNTSYNFIKYVSECLFDPFSYYGRKLDILYNSCKQANDLYFNEKNKLSKKFFGN